MKTIGLIPARLESSRLSRKLLLSETGKPLIQYAWENATRAETLDEVMGRRKGVRGTGELPTGREARRAPACGREARRPSQRVERCPLFRSQHDDYVYGAGEDGRRLRKFALVGGI